MRARKPHPHPIHSGDVIFEGDKHYHQHITSAATQNALDGCVAAIKGLSSKSEREALIGHLLATLVHDRDIDGLLRSFNLAGLSINHYHAIPETRQH